MSINVEYSTKELNRIVLENVIKMVYRRKLIKSVESAMNSIGDDFQTKTIYEIT
jgi:hypothetical protein